MRTEPSRGDTGRDMHAGRPAAPMADPPRSETMTPTTAAIPPAHVRASRQAPPLPLKLHHSASATPDAARVADFYQRIMGMEMVHTVLDDRVPSTGQAFPYIHLFFRMADGSTIAFFESPCLP